MILKGRRALVNLPVIIREIPKIKAIPAAEMVEITAMFWKATWVSRIPFFDKGE